MLSAVYRSTPQWAVLVLITVACLTLKEWFPFSHFPMYSRNAGEATVLFISDSQDAPVFTAKAFGRPVFQLKKLHDTALRKLKAEGKIRRVGDASPEQLAEIAREVLTYFKTGQSDAEPLVLPPSPLRLYRQRTKVENGEIIRTTDLLGEL